MVLDSELSKSDWKNDFDQSRANGVNSDDRGTNVHHKDYKSPAWAARQWKAGGKHGFKPEVIAHSKSAATLTQSTSVPRYAAENTVPGKQKIADKANADTEVKATTMFQDEATASPNHEIVSRLGSVDTELEAILANALGEPVSQSQRFFTIYGAPRKVVEDIPRRSQILESGLDETGLPMSDIYEIFKDMARTAAMEGLGDRIPSRPLRIFTMCSGTEAPLLAMKLMQEASKQLGEKPIMYEHLGSAEIKPFKQAFIERNYQPPVIFQNVREFTADCEPHTAYGGTQKQPEDVDILVAGFVCKDYSSLNQKTKKFAEDGKSYNTFTGIAGYANRHRPKIIILENVKGAPWWQIRNYLGAMGYEGVAVEVDTKNFYLPQTRQRGYMVAFDTECFTAAKFNIEAALDHWIMLMTKFQKRATSPFPEFLLPDDDPYLSEAKLGSRTSKARKNQPWDACRHRYAKWRVEKQLGTLRPMTKWQTNGSCIFPDFGWTMWARRQRERIWDTLDIEFLRHAGERGYDMNYKHRWLELSQNVDHGGGDRLQWGIVGCVTPTGLPYSTLRGGVVVGKELLSLQGIPIKELDLNREKMPQLQDLAGNAMSTPVVAAAIFSAIMAAQHGMLLPTRCFFTGDWRDLEIDTQEKKQWRNSGQAENQALESTHIESLSRSALWDSGADFEQCELTVEPLEHISTESLMHLAGKTMQMCACEAVPGIKAGTFKICKLCGHMACTVCCGNPQHEYSNISSEVLKERMPPAEFIESVWQALPTALQLRETESIITALESRLQNAARHACASPVTLRSVKRGDSWKVTYDGFGAILELHFVRKCNPGASTISDFFGDKSIDCHWLLFAKLDPRLDAEEATAIKGLLRRPIARMDVSGTLLRGEWQTAQEQKIEINIEPSSRSGWTAGWEKKLGLRQERFRAREVPKAQVVTISAEASVAKKALATSIEGVYSLLPHCGGASGSLHIRQQEGPPVFFFKDPEQLSNASDDRFVFAGTHHRLAYKEPRLLHARLDQEWEPQARYGHFDKNLASSAADSPVSSLVCTWISHIRPRLQAFAAPTPLRMQFPSKLSALISRCRECTDKAPSIMLLDIPLLEDELETWRGYQYQIPLIGEMAALRRFSWVTKRAILQLPNLGEWQDVDAFQTLVNPCSRCVPKAPKIEYRREGKICAARENVEEAIKYERTLHARPAPLSATMHCHSGDAILDVKLNLPTVIHRLIGRLGLVDSLEDADVAAEWRLSIDDGHEAQPTFKLSPIQNNKNESPLSPSAELFKRALWPEQQEAMAWMARQEEMPSHWDEQELEEVRFTGLSLRLDMKASIRKTVRGGILADDIGGGKTTTAAALIAYMLDKNPLVPQDECAISLKATLILVPQSLLNQWKGELEKCYGNNPGLSLLEIRDINQLMNTKLENLRKQDIILAPCSLFDSPLYWMNLAGLCGARNIPTEAGRAFQQWLREVLKDLRKLVKKSERNEAHPGWQSYKLSDNEKYDDFEGAAKGGKSTAVLKFRPLFHLFRFQRLIVDEYSYLEGFPFLAVLELQAVSKWMLSGTPPLATFDAVNTTARLIGTKVSSEDEKDGCFSFVTQGSKLKNHQTEAEEFQSYQNGHSPAWVCARYDSADAFTRQFIRKNHSDRADYVQPIVKRYVTPLTSMEQVTYFEVYQCLMSQGFAFNGAYTSNELQSMPREQRLAASIIMSRGPEDALLSCCCDMRGSMQGYANVVRQRKRDVLLSIEGLYDALKQIFGYASTRTPDEDPEQDNSHFLSYKLRIYNMEFGDESTAAIVDRLLWTAHRDQEVPQTPFSGGLERKKGSAKKAHIDMYPQTIIPRKPSMTNKEVAADLKTRTSEMKDRAEDLNTRTTKLVDEIRSLRFFNMITTALEGRQLPECSGCSTWNTADKTFIIGTCGHVACQACLDSIHRLDNNPDGCIAPNCHAATFPHHLIQASRFSAAAISRDRVYGSKMSAVIDKVQKILRKTEDKILIFVQLPRVAEALLAALDAEENIQYTDAVSPASSSGTLATPFGGPVEAFRRGNDDRVCVLLLDSPDAAGWNLQCANRVMFVSALLVESQSRYNAIMKQAIGRCDRFGQQKVVHIYHFLMSKTIEVNMWRDREAAQCGLVSEEHEGPGLQGAACGAGDVGLSQGDDEDEDEDMDDDVEMEMDDD